MTLKLRPSPIPGPSSPFSWDKVPASPHLSEVSSTPPSPPTQWLSARDMKIFGVSPLRKNVGFVRCQDCEKAVLKSAMAEHADNCFKYRNAAKKAGKGKEAEETKKGKKRKAEEEVPEDPSAPKKKKPMTKVTKGRGKGPVDLDKQCGVINDKNLPCSRSLTCKSHSMGAKRAVQGRSRPYDELLLEWNRQNNPNFVEPVKRESKQERKERKEKEKAEKKRLQQEQAAAAGIDLSKKSAGAGGSGTKKKKTTTAAAAAPSAGSAASGTKVQVEVHEDEDVDSETEMDALVKAVRTAEHKGILGVPLAVPCDASSWFVARRERVRTCRELLASALFSGARPGPAAGATLAAAPTRLVA